MSVSTPEPLDNKISALSHVASGQRADALEMTAPASTDRPSGAGEKLALKPLSWLDRLLALWIVLAMGLGILLGALVPSTSEVLDKTRFADVSLPIAIGLLVMMWPILCRISYTSVKDLFADRRVWRHLAFSLVVNWIIAPLLMVSLAWAFLPDRQGLREGLILVGIARCIAMVFIWTDIAGGDSQYCAVLVAANSLLQIVLYAPLGLFFLNVMQPGNANQVDISYGTVARSVGVFLGIPMGAAILTRVLFLGFLRKPLFFKRVVLPAIGPLSLIGLLFTIIVIFASQGEQVVQSITDVLRVAAPLLIYFIATFSCALLVCRKFGFNYRISAAQSFTAASNNFELAIAVAIASFGANSPQALASTVGPLIEVPVLLAMAHGLLRYRRWRKWDMAEETSSGEA